MSMTLDGSNATVTPLNIPLATTGAAPTQAGQLVGRNLIVNGSCAIDQVNSGALITPIDNGYSIDNVAYGLSQASKLQTQQVTNKLNSLGAVNSLVVSVLAQYTPLATDRFAQSFAIEGVNFARLQYGTANAQAASLQFKVTANVAGTYSGSIRNYAATRSYPFSFTVTTGDSLVKIESIPGDTGGVWIGATNAGAGYVTFDLGAGVNFKSTAGTWQAGNFIGVTGTTNLVSQVNGSTLSITDVQLEQGTFCTTFERKLYDQDLRECQRYLPTISWVDRIFGFAYTTTNSVILWPYKVPIRFPLTGIVVSSAAHWQGLVGSVTITNPTISFAASAYNFAEIDMSGATVTIGQGARLAGVSPVGLIYGVGARI